MGIDLSAGGNLAESAFSEVLLQAVKSRMTGALDISSGKVRRQVMLSDGRPVAVTSNALSESLVRLLEASGRISPETLSQLRAQMKEVRRPLEDLLIEQGIVQAEEMPRLMGVVHQARLSALFQATEGTWQAVGQTVAPGAELPVPQVLTALLRKKAASESPMRSLMARRRESPRRVIAPPFGLASFGLSTEAAGFYASLDGSRSVAELMTGSGLPTEEVALLIQIFTATGMIEDARGLEAGPSMPPVFVPPPSAGSSTGGMGAAPPVMTVPVMTPPVMAPPVMTPPVQTVPVMTQPVMAPPVMAPPVMAPPVLTPPPAAAVPEDDGSAGRYVYARPSVAESVHPEAPERKLNAPSPSMAATLSGGASRGSSIDDLIAEEVGQLDAPVPIVPRRVDQDPLLEFSMSGFSQSQKDTALKFKDDYVRLARQNYFEMLGVERTTKTADVRKAYFVLAKEYHTDRLGGLPEPVQRLGREIFGLIQTAYDTLSEVEPREKYVAATFYGKKDDEEAAIAEVQIVLQADQHYKTGIGLLNAGNLTGAHAAFGRARDMYPKEAEYNACYGFTLFRLSYPANQEKCKEAEKLIEDALRQNPKLDRANLFLGRMALIKDNSELAAKYFVRALKINPTNMEAGRELQNLKAKRDQQETGLFSSLFGRFKR